MESPHFNLWKYLYALKIVATKGKKQRIVGGCGFSLHPKKVQEYFNLELMESNKG